MNQLEKLLAENNYLLLDGAMGTMLFGMGLEAGAPPEAWNVDHPERIKKVHNAYIAAGSQIILTNTFGGSSFRLKLHHLQDRVYELNKAAAEIAREAADAADKEIVVAGSIGPSGELLIPMGTMSFADAEAAFAEQARGLSDGGADVLWIETMSDLNEVKAAVSGARSVCDLPIAATMSFDTKGNTMMGVTPQQALSELKALNLIAIGANCGNGLAEIIGVIEAMQAVDPEMTLIAKSNAGIPKWVNDELSYDGTPPIMASYANLVHRLGARLIGGCCGSGPEHIAAMSEALGYFGTQQRETAVVEPDNDSEGRTRKRRRARS